MNEKSSFLCSALPWAAERCLRVCQRLASHLTTANRPFRLLSSSTKNYPSRICLCLCLSVLIFVSFVSSSRVCLYPFVSLCLTGCFIFCMSLPVYVAAPLNFWVKWHQFNPEWFIVDGLPILLLLRDFAAKGWWSELMRIGVKRCIKPIPKLLSLYTKEKACRQTESMYSTASWMLSSLRTMVFCSTGSPKTMY